MDAFSSSKPLQGAPSVEDDLRVGVTIYANKEATQAAYDIFKAAYNRHPVHADTGQTYDAARDAVEKIVRDAGEYEKNTRDAITIVGLSVDSGYRRLLDEVHMPAAPLKSEVTKKMKWYVCFDGETTIYPGDVFTYEEVRELEPVGDIDVEEGYGARLVGEGSRTDLKTEWEICATAKEAKEMAAHMLAEYQQAPKSVTLI